MKQVAFIGVLAVVVGACGLAGATGAAPAEPAGPALQPEPVVMEPPPLARINGIEGVVTTFCWTSGCADAFGHPDPARLPRVSAPLQIWLPLPVRELQVAAVGPGPGGREVPLDVEDLVVSGPLPQGTVSVKVGIWFEVGGDALYYWAVGDPSPSDAGASSPSEAP